jgi:hypothetical protein
MKELAVKSSRNTKREITSESGGGLARDSDKFNKDTEKFFRRFVGKTEERRYKRKIMAIRFLKPKNVSNLMVLWWLRWRLIQAKLEQRSLLVRFTVKVSNNERYKHKQ